MAARTQAFTVDLSQDRTAASREHTVVAFAQVVEHFRFEVAKALFPFAFEIFADRATEVLFQRMVRINKGEVQSPSELSPDGRFARTWQTHQYQQSLLSEITVPRHSDPAF